MLDVGAHSGESLARFAEDGWTVHAFEPDPANRAKLEAVAGQYARVTVVPAAVGAERGQMVLYKSAESSGISSLAAFTPGHTASERVDVVSLGAYMQEHGIRAVDFLKVDVEGYERMVLDGYDWSVLPRLVELEFEDRKTVPLGYTWRDLVDLLQDRGYMVVVSEWEPIQRYGTGQSWRCWGTEPYRLADADGWGNLLAARSVDDRELLLRAMKRMERIYRARKALHRR